MAQREVIWSSNAQKEFAEILAYFTERNKSTEYSLKLIDSVENITHLISENPFLGLENEGDNSRTFILKNYSIIYDFNDHNISILSFWDDRQNPENRLRIKKHRGI
jgi:plasmid stabilization system protein ParE